MIRPCRCTLCAEELKENKQYDNSILCCDTCAQTISILRIKSILWTEYDTIIKTSSGILRHLDLRTCTRIFKIKYIIRGVSTYSYWSYSSYHFSLKLKSLYVYVLLKLFTNMGKMKACTYDAL